MAARSGFPGPLSPRWGSGIKEPSTGGSLRFTPGYMLASPSGFKNGLCIFHDVGKGEGLAMRYVAYAFQMKGKKTQS